MDSRAAPIGLPPSKVQHRPFVASPRIIDPRIAFPYTLT